MAAQNDIVLIAEDNPDDALLLKRALSRAGMKLKPTFLEDGEQLLLYLMGQGEYANRTQHPFPALIILDLKMPRKSGLEVLEWLQQHPDFAVVPTVVLSASSIEKDIRKAYQYGANTYFVKPSTFDELVETIKSLKLYWSRAERIQGGRTEM